MNLIILIGPPGSGKSTLAKDMIKTNSETVYVNQDSQTDHFKVFTDALVDDKDVIVDRMGFSKEQRAKYIVPAKALGYQVKIIVLHESRETCLERMKNRTNHETIKDEKTARRVLDFFFSNYERPTMDEGYVEFRYPKLARMPSVLIVDIDGTIADVSHRLHYVQGEGKKNWKQFFKEIANDKVNLPVAETIHYFCNYSEEQAIPFVYCSGRPDNYKKETEEWLDKNVIGYHDHLFMRPRNDRRPDFIIKEIILDFEILTRYRPFLVLDDRSSVISMWRNRGLTAFQVAPGDF